MKKTSFALAVVGLIMAATAEPVVKASSVTMTQRGDTVTIRYEIENEPGVVTVDIQTNGVSIGGQYLTHFAGDVNRLVDVGQHTMTWKPRKAWPDEKIVDGVTAVVTAWATNAPPDYMAVHLVAAETVRYYADKESVPFGVTNDMYKTDWLLMRKIPAANGVAHHGDRSLRKARKGPSRDLDERLLHRRVSLHAAAVRADPRGQTLVVQQQRLLRHAPRPEDRLRLVARRNADLRLAEYRSCRLSHRILWPSAQSVWHQYV